ncbi:membrane protein insertase YidC [Ligilactobacillus sp. Marseille-Q7487]|uniref:membrane protein insertase YidC n=1 Tax=Ligilactobacillus sp. Marseille-Q7487 TaxID=3022128 RepID=UPI0024A8C83F|nr:membrane protein insertase YidC [Ligilactobacillus sp. Marseille-Q7487]
MKRGKRFAALLAAVSLMLVLAGCSTAPIDAQSTGFWDHYIVWNFVKAIQALSNIFGHNYGWGIVVFTIIVRIVILPLMIYQMNTSRKTMELQPQIKALQQKYSARDTETMRKLQAETQKLYSKAGVHPMASMLPLIVQMPIMIALYQAIFRSETLKVGQFFWMQLGDKDPYYVMPILAAIFTYLTSKLSMMAQPESNAMMTVMTYAMPVFIFFIGLNVPAALSLYWMITNAFSVAQTWFFNNPYKINREREEKQRAEKQKQRQLEKAKRKALKNKKK